MVVALFVIIAVAVIDRIFYTTFAFFNRAAVNKLLKIDAPLVNSDTTSMVMIDEE